MCSASSRRSSMSAASSSSFSRCCFCVSAVRFRAALASMLGSALAGFPTRPVRWLLVPATAGDSPAASANLASSLSVSLACLSRKAPRRRCSSASTLSFLPRLLQMPEWLRSRVQCFDLPHFSASSARRRPCTCIFARVPSPDDKCARSRMPVFGGAHIIVTTSSSLLVPLSESLSLCELSALSTPSPRRSSMGETTRRSRRRQQFED